MYIDQIAHYLPHSVVNNDFFLDKSGLSDEWITERTGMRERRKAEDDENTNTMGIDAVKHLQLKIDVDLSDVDLIVGGTYTPFDTIFTLGHAVQRYVGAENAMVLSLSSACSSFINVMEVIEGYFAMGKATKALAVVSDHNSRFADVTDKKAGHLWGDGASALYITKKKHSEESVKVLDIITRGGGTLGKANESVNLNLIDGLYMPNGRDVFIHACQYMTEITREILSKNDLTPEDLNYFIPHQANLRITKNVGDQLGLRTEQTVSNVEYLGNTGCAGCTIGLSERFDRLSKDDLIALSVFGGGYSYGSMLLKK
ncbi:3-oxoacyl-ACP synthase III family protein [Marinigracilibium pacificum]|uniref:Ketoacyl-ACP synthase III n=1 Tax=Marinigracilibium pacificum TaxID=2729599 RepID=A0A848IWN2_9BACT|nr:ketoacyl-ACP synthase III [Marinigracilibium pacificum]NMM48076.1 ketoacyl-ACP synthase III [Marinigracilibium pacificum]